MYFVTCAPLWWESFVVPGTQVGLHPLGRCGECVLLPVRLSFVCIGQLGGGYFTACLVSLLFALVSMGSVLSCLFSLSFVCIGQCGEESVCSTGATHFSFRCPDSSSSSQITWQASTTIVWPYASTLSSLCYDRREHMLAFHQPVPVHKMPDLKSRRLELILFIRFRKQEVQDFRLPVPTYLERGVGQNHIYTSYMTVYLAPSRSAVYAPYKYGSGQPYSSRRNCTHFKAVFCPQPPPHPFSAFYSFELARCVSLSLYI